MQASLASLYELNFFLEQEAINKVNQIGASSNRFIKVPTIATFNPCFKAT